MPAIDVVCGVCQAREDVVCDLSIVGDPSKKSIGRFHYERVMACRKKVIEENRVAREMRKLYGTER